MFLGCLGDGRVHRLGITLLGARVLGLGRGAVGGGRRGTVRGSRRGAVRGSRGSAVAGWGARCWVVRFGFGLGFSGDRQREDEDESQPRHLGEERERGVSCGLVAFKRS